MSERRLVLAKNDVVLRARMEPPLDAFTNRKVLFFDDMDDEIHVISSPPA